MRRPPDAPHIRTHVFTFPNRYTLTEALLNELKAQLYYQHCGESFLMCFPTFQFCERSILFRCSALREEPLSVESGADHATTSQRGESQRCVASRAL